MFDPKMISRIETGNGFIAALDQSGGSTPGALKNYGLDENAYSGEEQMFALIHAMRCRVLTAPSFTGDRILGAILYEKTMSGQADGKAVPALLRERNILPFLKIDRGLQPDADGVQLMRAITDLDAVLKEAKVKGMIGTKMRSVIHRASPSGIASIVGQQFEIAKLILAHDLLPIIEPEVHISSAERAQCDALLREEIKGQLDSLPNHCKVILKLSLPAQANLFTPLVDHPRVARVAALSGGYSRDKACEQLEKNRGMVASFSRALLQDLRRTMTDEEFDHALGQAIDQIYAASTQKTQ